MLASYIKRVYTNQTKDHSLPFLKNKIAQAKKHGMDGH